MEIKKVFEKYDKHSSFIKTTVRVPVAGSEKAALNRKGNQFFNEGNIEGARRIFLTTGYSDGLSRVGDFYKSKNQIFDALQMYWLAPDRNKSQPIIEQLAGIVRDCLKEDKKDVYNVR